MSKYIRKTSYYQFAEEVSKLDNGEDVIRLFQSIFDFDPSKPITDKKYSPKVAEYIKSYRQRKKDEGISTYVSSGVKSAYHKKKLEQ